MRVFTLALIAGPAAAWFVRAYRRSDDGFIFDDRGNRIRRIVREEIANADAEWDEKCAADLGILGEAGFQRQAERLRTELDDPQAVASWLWSEGRS